MQMLRQRLPSGIVGVLFGSNVVVDDQVEGGDILAVVALAFGRGGLFAVVMQSELDRVLAMVA